VPKPAEHHHFPFYAAGVARCGCKEHFGLTPVQADAELPDPPPPPADLIVRAEQKRRADIAARRAQRRNRRAGGA
jgi:hypothetical protein